MLTPLEVALDHKAKGNELYDANDWDGALAAYEQAVRSLRTLEVTARTPEVEALMVVLYSNSAQAALEKKDYALALRMSGYAIDIDPNHEKSCLRYKVAEEHLGDPTTSFQQSAMRAGTANLCCYCGSRNSQAWTYDPRKKAIQCFECVSRKLQSGEQEVPPSTDAEIAAMTVARYRDARQKMRLLLGKVLSQQPYSVTMALEEQLWIDAQALSEYMDMQTLQVRMQRAAQTLKE